MPRRNKTKPELIQHFTRSSRQMNDTTGKQLKLGQIVDLQLIGMFRGTIVQINESTIVTRPGVPPTPPHIIIDVQIPKFIAGPSPELQCIYVVQDPPAEPPSEDKEKNILLS